MQQYETLEKVNITIPKNSDFKIRYVSQTNGYDGHGLRAFYYYPERLPGITNTIASINSIEANFPKVRQESKGPTFTLTYLGTYFALMRNQGFSEEQAKKIESNYHELYKVSDAYIEDKLDQATRDGYVTLAFGLRLRTPVLARTVRKSKTTPYATSQEGRTAANALGQGYGLLNNRALNEFMDLVWKSKYKYDIKPINTIHDSIYLLVKSDIKIIKWVNDTLIKCMQWQELPEIQHPTVKLGAELEIYYNGWHQAIKLPNKATKKEIQTICKRKAKEYNNSDNLLLD